MQCWTIVIGVSCGFPCAALMPDAFHVKFPDVVIAFFACLKKSISVLIHLSVDFFFSRKKKSCLFSIRREIKVARLDARRGKTDRQQRLQASHRTSSLWVQCHGARARLVSCLSALTCPGERSLCRLSERSDVQSITDDDRADIAAFPFDGSAELAAIGAKEFYGEAGYSTLERRWAVSLSASRHWSTAGLPL
jgi:hypothetical protein